MKVVNDTLFFQILYVESFKKWMRMVWIIRISVCGRGVVFNSHSIGMLAFYELWDGFIFYIHRVA